LIFCLSFHRDFISLSQFASSTTFLFSNTAKKEGSDVWVGVVARLTTLLAFSLRPDFFLKPTLHFLGKPNTLLSDLLNVPYSGYSSVTMELIGIVLGSLPLFALSSFKISARGNPAFSETRTFPLFSDLIVCVFPPVVFFYSSQEGFFNASPPMSF